MNPKSNGRDALLTPAEVAAMFFVDPKTVTRWAATGKVKSIRTPGGHRRYLESEMLALRDGVAADPSARDMRVPDDAPLTPTDDRGDDRRDGDRRGGDRRGGDRRGKQARRAEPQPRPFRSDQT